MANLCPRHCEVRTTPRVNDNRNAGSFKPSPPFEMTVLLMSSLSHRVLKPGGWVQMIEIYFNVQSDNGSITDEHALRRWSTQYMRAQEDRKDLRIGTRLRSMLTSAGLTEVDTKMIPLPLSAWGNGKPSSSLIFSEEAVLTQYRSEDTRYRPGQQR